MTDSHNRRFFGLKKEKASVSPKVDAGPANVHGWLMNVPGYREDASAVPADQNRDGHSLLVDGDNNIIPIETNSRHRRQGRPESISSIGSEDSVDLQDLINANFTVDMDDETNLTDLAELGLEDSEDFLKTYETLDSLRPILHGTKSNNNKAATATISLEDDFENFLNIGNKHHVQHELDWSPEEDHMETMSNHSSQTIHYRPGAAQFRQTASLIERGVREQRSGSMSSENSLNSQSTITTGLNQFTRFGPPIYPSESTSTSSRSHSRLSNYSASSQASSAASPILPRPSGMPTPSRSYTRKDVDSHSSLPRPGSRMKSSLVPTGRSPSALPTRPSHIPAPKTSTPNPEKTLSSKKPTQQQHQLQQQKQQKPQQTHQSITMGRSDSRIAQRTSHIPNVSSTPHSPIMSPVDSRRYSALSRPTSPMRANTTPRTSLFSTPPSRITIVKPIPPTTGFKPPQRRHNTQPLQTDQDEETSRTTGLSGLRPPSKSMSRIGMMKKPSNRP